MCNNSAYAQVFPSNGCGLDQWFASLKHALEVWRNVWRFFVLVFFVCFGGSCDFIFILILFWGQRARAGGQCSLRATWCGAQRGVFPRGPANWWRARPRLTKVVHGFAGSAGTGTGIGRSPSSTEPPSSPSQRVWRLTITPSRNLGSEFYKPLWQKQFTNFYSANLSNSQLERPDFPPLCPTLVLHVACR